MAITFDKMAYYGRLKDAGVQEPMARAMADGLDQALKEEVATKTDLELIRVDLSGRISLTHWMAGANITLSLLILGKMLIFAS